MRCSTWTLAARLRAKISPAPLLLATLGLFATSLPLLAAPKPATVQKKAPKSSKPVTLAAALEAAGRVVQASSGDVGIQVIEIESGKTVYDQSGDRPLIIASNTKLITSATALDRLGPAYQFETPLYLRGEVVDGVLQGDLAVVGGGDPNISGRFYDGDSFAVFKTWAAALRARGIRQVSGNLILVTGLFDDVLIHPDWARQQLDRWYQAPVAALSFNDNCVLIKVVPTAGASALARLEPNLPIFKLQGKVGVIASAKGQNVMIGRRLAGDATNLATYTVGGQIYRRSGSVDEWITVADPVGYFGAGLRQAFNEQAITVLGGTVRVASLSSGSNQHSLSSGSNQHSLSSGSNQPEAPWQEVAVHRSEIQRTLQVLNKRSQNFYAESVLKLLGARFGGGGNWPSGVKVATEMLGRVGIQGPWSMVDGSGLSRADRFSPAQLTKLLRHMFFHKYGSEFIRTLPYSGEADLRWEQRLAQPPYRGNVMAKTGTLSDVSTLSGYAKARSGKIYAFSILCNRTRGNFRATGAQDAFLRALIDRG